MRTLILEGWLAEEYGSEFRVQVDSAGAAIRLLCANFPDFKTRVGTEDQEFAVLVANNNGINHEQINMPIPEEAEIRIIPMIAGAKSGGAFQTIVGIVLVVVGVILSYFSAGLLSTVGGYMVKMGIVMMISGVAQMLIGTPKAPKTSTTEKADNTPSDLFNGAVNTSAQGNPAPLCYGGPIVVGSYVVSAGYSTVQVPV